MRELKPVANQSQPGTRIVCEVDGEEFVLAVTDELRALMETPTTPQSVPEPEPETTPEPEPEPAAPKYIMPPREIQDRVRAGATIDELVAETGMPVKRIDAFAHPVLADRARIAEQGKKSHPRRADGPAKLTLQEILAAAFTARGLELSEATWDSRRDQTGQWIVSLTWQAGHSDNTAEWSYHDEGAGSGTTVARNQAAAELVDPENHRPRRGLAAVSETTPIMAQEQQPEPADEDPDDSDFMLNPEEERPRRRRSTVMPSWEDVLLGVRPTDRK
ncbi:DUF3071 domain-containing protein [Corynebacterium sp. TAE3-ERU12]|uniref:septation protein SepH n=1 Tax=Corynebacterium sp. TAE3-ERU12 TaxID=2849491 RepID=UPI001C44C43C|nr:septation protein SepH [Corynebacterium sp. TAE3-ERU12]MBV7295548.1 DUF3071 domain-containing protein [Corynebacterium sp. TAE3-ERU12]